MLRLEAQKQALQISEAQALTRAEAAERVLKDAQAGRAELAARLEGVETPVAEARGQLNPKPNPHANPSPEPEPEPDPEPDPDSDPDPDPDP